MGRFDNKVVLISGTGGSQGQTAALAFAREGAKVVGCDYGYADRSEETVRMVREAGGEMESLAPLDLADPKEAQRWVDLAISRWSGIDILYNNAGGLKLGRMDSSIDDWNYTIRNELTLTFVATHAVWPHLIARGGGVIINIASLSGHREHTDFPSVAHGAANAGIQALSRTLAAEGARHNIRSVSISPGPVRLTHGKGHFPDPGSPDYRKTFQSVPMGRPAEPQEIINVAMFLASAEASYITGTDVAVDGGTSGIIWADTA